MRRLVYVGVLTLVVGTLVAARPKPGVTINSVRATRLSDTTLRVISTWGYKTSPTTGVPDSTRVRHALGTATPSTKWVKWPKKTDTTVVTVAAYGTINGTSCFAPSRRGQMGAEVCRGWTFVRPDPPPPGFDTVVTEISVRPQGVQVDPDIGLKCKTWQDAHPGQSYWASATSVNRVAVPPCMGPNGVPVIAQFCGFVTLRDGRLALASQQVMIQYCVEQFESWKAERSG